MRPIWLVQLPFPSSADPNQQLSAYYKDYSKKFASAIPEYFIREDALWELPLWIAHLAGLLEAIGSDYQFLDLSGCEPEADVCLSELLPRIEEGEIVMLSPLAQNLDIATGVSKRLLELGRLPVIGGNMAGLVNQEDAFIVYRGLIDVERITALISCTGDGSVSGIEQSRRGRITWTPNYSRLAGYKVPLLRLNASHGCLYNCSFCGDAWSRKLYVVELSALEAEVKQFEELFPDTQLLYIGDKTFGQSREGIANLCKVLAQHPRYRLIVQSHINQIDGELIDLMRKLRVVVVELGLETADRDMLKQSAKDMPDEDVYLAKLKQIKAAGINVVLNLLGGLPMEQPSSHDKTLTAMRRWSSVVWLYNLYNFVPYPLTPYFESLKDRIFTWNFSCWREDMPPVFHPYHQSADESWSRFLEKIAVAHEVINSSPGARRQNT